MLDHLKKELEIINKDIEVTKMKQNNLRNLIEINYAHLQQLTGKQELLKNLIADNNFLSQKPEWLESKILNDDKHAKKEKFNEQG